MRKNFTGENVKDLFSHCFRYFFNYISWMIWHTGILSGFLYGRYVLVSKFISTLRKLTILRLVCIAMFKKKILNRLIMDFLFLLISGLDEFLTFAKSLPVYEPTWSLSRILHNTKRSDTMDWYLVLILIFLRLMCKYVAIYSATYWYIHHFRIAFYFVFGLYNIFQQEFEGVL